MAEVAEVKKCRTCSAEYGPNDDARFRDCASCRTGSESQGAPEMTTGTAAKDLPSTAIKIAPAKPRPEDEAPRSRYWCGIVASSPLYSVVLAGFGFIKQQGKMDHDNDDVMPTFRGQRGEDLYLTEKEVAAICDAVKIRVVRSFGAGAGARYGIFVIGSRMYRHDPRDEPLAKHVYMHRVTESMPADWRLNSPEPMLQE